MEIVRFDMPTRDLDINIAGDAHKGAVNCHHKLVEDLAKLLGKPRQYLAPHGDWVEAIAPNDKRFTMKAVDLDCHTTDLQLKEIQGVFEPRKKRMLYWGDGNHELKLANIFTPGQYLAERFGVPYGGYNCVVQCFYHGVRKFDIFVSHGFGILTSNAKDQLQREGNLNAALKQKLIGTGISNCIVMAMGHTHQLRVVEPTVDKEIHLVASGNKVKELKRAEVHQTDSYIPPEHRWFVNTGSFLKLYSAPGSGVTSYAEMRGYRPTHLGWARVNVRDCRVVGVEKMA